MRCVQRELCPSCNLISNCGKIIKTPVWVAASPSQVCAPWERAGCWKHLSAFQQHGPGGHAQGTHGEHADQHGASSFPVQSKIPQTFVSLREWLALSSEIKMDYSEMIHLWRAEELKEWEMYYFSREGKSLMQFWTEFSNMRRIYTKHTEATFDVSSWK